LFLVKGRVQSSPEVRKINPVRNVWMIFLKRLIHRLNLAGIEIRRVAVAADQREEMPNVF